MTRRSAFIIAAVLAAVVLFIGMKTPLRREWEEGDHSKYIKFSHTAHVKDRGIACEDCHSKAKASKTSSEALIPDHESCQGCHEEQVSKNCVYCHLSADNIVGIPHPDRALIFSHEKHVTAQALKCETCHAGVDSVATAGNANMPPMPTCIGCHTEKNVSRNCESCHRNFTSLVPDDHLKGDFVRGHKMLARVGMLDVKCGTCHTETFCQDCHSGTQLLGFGFKSDLITEPMPKSSVKDSPRQMKLQHVHSLDYRFTHGIDAKSKVLDCTSCHEYERFCSDCHQAGGNITQKKFKPESHSVAGFTTMGKGSGGGRHAELARRDIEACAACHDVQGADPTCMLCHKENGTVR